jgi:hypothetical protein
VLAVFAQILYHRMRAGEIRMRKIWAVLVVIALGLALGACTKCDVPDLLPKTCKTGTGSNQL